MSDLDILDLQIKAYRQNASGVSAQPMNCVARAAKMGKNVSLMVFRVGV